MASNKFATMLQRNTNRITTILIYTVLEWFLITLLLLNSLFSYFITKFVDYFGLKPPCLWCSRIDHVLNRTNNSDPYRNQLCEAHSAEISQLGYCKIHRRLAEYETMCIDCFSSWPNLSNEQVGITRSIGYISWVSNDAIENGGMALTCSCCDASLSQDLYPPCLLVKTSWGAAMKCSQKRGSVVEAIDEVNKHEPLVSYDEVSFETEKNDREMHPNNSVIPCCLQDYSSLEIVNPERNSGMEIDRTVPLELIDLSTISNHGLYDSKADGLKRVDQANEAIFVVDDNQEKTNLESFEEKMANMEKLQVIDIEEMVQDMVEEACKQVVSSKQARALSITSHSDCTGLQMNKSDELSVCKEEETDDITISVDQTMAVDVNKLSDGETNQPQSQEPSSPLASQTEDLSSLMAMVADIPRAPEICSAPDEFGARLEEIIAEPRTSADKKEGGKSHISDPNEAYDDKLPETPNSVDSIHNLHKKLLVEKRETGAEESMDGSVVSESEGGDPVLTIEKLKAALNAERKALSSLYAELEEERSASAIAANQTMAMINRLQEEKAAVQMEALQYQRMMEEQTEYDQEALQLLNELMIKREKEKQELEKELEVYRQKVLNYETKEKTGMMRSIRSRSSSATCSNGEDIDEISFDFNRESKDFDRGSHGMEINNNNATNGVDEVTNLQEIALDCVKQMTALDDSLVEFEEERLSILDQLKALEEKLLHLNENDIIEDENSTEHSSKYCIKGLNESYELNTPEGEGGSCSLPNEKCYPESKTMGSMVKNLLPLLDAADDDTEEFSFEDISASEPTGRENSPASNSELESKKIAIEEEVDHVYERLQALEADREFLKHCMSSIQKGDKGMDLLQEILQHLRDLRAAELRTRDMNADLLQQF